MKYTTRAKIVSVIKTTTGNYHIVYQRIGTIDNINNPFHGQRKMAVSTLNKFGTMQLMQMWKLEKVSKLINKQVILRMEDDGSLFEKVDGICKDMTFGFRTIPQKLPNFVMVDVEYIAKGDMYVR